MKANSAIENSIFPAYPIKHVVVGSILEIVLLITLNEKTFLGEFAFYASMIAICVASALIVGYKAKELFLDTNKVQDKVFFGVKVGMIFFSLVLSATVVPAFLIIYSISGPTKLLSVIGQFTKAVGLNFLNWRAFSAIPLSVTAEEIFYRGWMYPAFRARLGAKRAIILSAVLFMLVHPGNIIGMFIVFIGAVILAWLVEKKQSLIPALVFHAMSRVFSTLFYGLG